jgi:hypothetical protein
MRFLMLRASSALGLRFGFLLLDAPGWALGLIAAAAILLLAPGAAFAADIAEPPLHQLLDILMPLAWAVVSAAVPILLHAILVKAKLDKNVALAGLLTAATGRAGGIAYSAMVAEADHLGDEPIKNVAIAKGVNYLAAALPDTIKALGVTPDHLGAMVSAELGRLLAADPNVAIPPAPPRPAPAPLPADPAPVPVVVDAAPAAAQPPAAAPPVIPAPAVVNPAPGAQQA